MDGPQPSEGAGRRVALTAVIAAAALAAIIAVALLAGGGGEESEFADGLGATATDR